MTTTLMMKDIPITNREYSSYDDECLFEMIVEFYNTYNQTNIRSLWEFHFLLDFDEEGFKDSPTYSDLMFYLYENEILK